MKCYNHHDTDAVGVCKNCGKGICTDCLTDTGNGVACTNSCAEKMRTQRKKAIVVSAVAGSIIIVVGVMYGYRGYVRQDWVIILFSVFIIVMGILSIARGSKRNNGNN